MQKDPSVSLEFDCDGEERRGEESKAEERRGKKRRGERWGKKVSSRPLVPLQLTLVLSLCINTYRLQARNARCKPSNQTADFTERLLKAADLLYFAQGKSFFDHLGERKSYSKRVQRSAETDA